MYRDKNEISKRTLPDLCKCTSCTSSDALRIYEHTMRDGSVWYDASCFSCNVYEPDPPGFYPGKTDKFKNRLALQESTPMNSFQMNPPSTPSYTSTQTSGDPYTKEKVLEEFKLYPFRALKDRYISKETCEKYGVRVSVSPTDGETIVTHMYPYYKKGKLSGYKQRIVESKTMFSKGDCTGADLFGTHVHKPNGKTLFITEGELDCLALYQVLKDLSNIPWDPAVISLSHGAASAVKDISLSIEYVNSFEKIVLCFDMDDPGKAAAEDACKLLAGKVYVATYSEKDANDMLIKGKAEELKWDVLKHARLYMPDSIVDYAECWDRYKNGKNQTCYYWPEEWTQMNKMTYGFRLGELITITAGSGVGKTQIMRELKYHFFNTTDFKFADIALEEDVGDSMAGLMALHLNKRITLPDIEVSLDEEKEAFDYLFSTNRWAGYDYFGGLDDDNLFSKIRFLAARGHQIIFLDHLSIIVSEFAAEGGERERIDTLMTKLAKLVKELNITIFLIVHLRKADGKPFEEGHVPSSDDLRGSGSIKQLSWMIIAISRNQQHPDPFCANTSELTILKCRFTGRTGTADYLNFNEFTGRMIAVAKPENYRQTKNGKGSAFSMDF